MIGDGMQHIVWWEAEKETNIVYNQNLEKNPSV
jgi:hypothetical protein